MKKQFYKSYISFEVDHGNVERCKILTHFCTCVNGETVCGHIGAALLVANAVLGPEKLNFTTGCGCVDVMSDEAFEDATILQLRNMYDRIKRGDASLPIMLWPVDESKWDFDAELESARQTHRNPWMCLISGCKFRPQGYGNLKDCLNHMVEPNSAHLAAGGWPTLVNQRDLPADVRKDLKNARTNDGRKHVLELWLLKRREDDEAASEEHRN